MNLEKPLARKMKARIMRWLRLDQRCAFIATEVGMYSADVLGINEKKMIEVEVKISKEDLLVDFRKPKHWSYKNQETASYNQWIPTHFYFAVPADLVGEAIAILEKKDLVGKYGLIRFDDMKIVRRAHWLHKNEPSTRVKYVAALRMGSELIRFHEDWML